MYFNFGVIKDDIERASGAYQRPANASHSGGASRRGRNGGRIMKTGAARRGRNVGKTTGGRIDGGRTMKGGAYRRGRSSRVGGKP